MVSGKTAMTALAGLARFSVACSLAVALAGSAEHSAVWPPPAFMQLSGPSVPLSPSFFVDTSTYTSARLRAAADRTEAHVASLRLRAAPAGGAPPSSSTTQLVSVNVFVGDGGASQAGFPSLRSDYSHSLTCSSSAADAAGTADHDNNTHLCTVHAESIYGAMAALETLKQLLLCDEVSTSSGGTCGVSLLHSDISVKDAPVYAWRGLMIDSGRRFFPVPLVHLQSTVVHF